jgi:phage shock protein PspC (stress-responsive transcriptional regulator)
MNKTVNINLAGVFFHIDEDAYAKLQRYLSAIKRSFEGVNGEEEIIADIEARIAELFSSRIKDDRQVIGTTELDEVIKIMGQPEDYMVDDDIFEDAPSGKKKSRTRAERPGSGKKLYRDVDNAYIGGVSSGLGHYFGIDSLWIRLALVLIVIAGVGFPIFLYILLWVLIPEANSTADKLSMTGKAVNIDNIQEKVKEGFENVTDAVKNVDYDAYGNKIKKGTQGFFGAIGSVIMFFLKVLAKIFGVLFIIAGASTVIALFVGLFTAGTFDIFYDGGIEQFDNIVYPSGAPVWVTSLLVFFAVGVPFFFLFYLGLKILATNLKSMPLAGKLTLLGLWLVSVIGLGVIGIREATEHSFSGKVTTEERLDITKGDTLRVAMRTSEAYDIPIGRSNNSVMRIDASGERTYVNRNVRLIVRETQDATGYFKVVKEADGSTFNAAKEEAGYIDYSYEVTAGNLNLDGFFTSSRGKRYRDQEVEVILYLPEGAYLYADDNTYSYHRNSSSYRDILDNGTEEKYLLLEDGEFICDDCGSKSRESSSWERDNEGEWQYDSYEEGNKPDWENTSAATQLIITNDEVRLSIGTLTTRNELDTIKQQLKRDKNIDMSYSGSEFTPRGRIKKLSLEIDCNDGYSGKTINWAKSLDSNSIGFKRDYTLDAAEPFIIGEL